MAGTVGLQCVPVIYRDEQILLEPLSKILEMADGKGLRANYREGLVWREMFGKTSFKVVSNKYLNKEE